MSRLSALAPYVLGYCHLAPFVDSPLAPLPVAADPSQTVVIHCWGGCGRSGIVAACVLGALYPTLTADEAIGHVNSYFRLRSDLALRPHK